MTEQAVFYQQKTVSYTTPLWLSEKANLRKISYQSGIHKEPKYLIRLTEEERAQLTEVVNKGQAAAYKIKHANVLLKVDANGPDWNDVQTAEAFSCAPRTVSSLHQRFVEQGLEAALERKKQARPSREPIPDVGQEAHLIQLACSESPAGRAR